MRRFTMSVLFVSIMLISAFSSSHAGDLWISDNAELVYSDETVQLFRIPNNAGFQAPEAATPGVYVENVEVAGVKNDKIKAWYNFDTTMVPLYRGYFQLNYKVYSLTMKVQVNGPEKFTKTVEFKEGGPFEPDFYVASILGKAHKKTGIYSVMATITAKGKPSDKKMSKETCRYIIYKP